MTIVASGASTRLVPFVLLGALVSGSAFAQQVNPDLTPVIEGERATDWPVIFVRVDEHTNIETLLSGIIAPEPEADVAVAAFQGAVVSRVSAGIPDADLDRILARTRAATGREPVDPRREAYVRLTDVAQLQAGIEHLLAQPGVSIARQGLQPSDPDNPGNYQGLQGYENSPNFGGIGAETVWAEYGITGEGVAVCDVEYDHDEDHCDLPNVQMLGSTPAGVHNHGTAVLGEMVALNNGFGMTGIAYGSSDVYFASWSLGGVSGAIYRAINGMPEGSVIVIEVHIPGPNATGSGQTGYVPAEWSESTYNAIVSAVSNGMIVVAAAGNGSEDLDDPIYSTGHNGHWPFLEENDSGAIMVGAGGAYGNCGAGSQHLARLGFSCYGSRVDVQAYGECVPTLGYGDLFDDDANCDFTRYFSGTSSATPIVAGAVMLIQSYAQEVFGRPLTAEEMRKALIETGQPQAGNTSEHIGPFPNAIAAIESLDFAPPCAADINGDRVVDGGDLSMVLGFWGLAGEADLDGSGAINGSDLTILLSAWGPCPE